MVDDIRIEFAKLEDLSYWMEMVDLVRWNFPGLDTEEMVQSYQDTVIKNINRNSAICAKHNKKVVGVLLYSVKYNMLCCMAVHPDYRQNGIATKMIDLMISQLPKNCDIVVSTFREDDEKGVAPRTLYKKIGFVEDELCYEFEYPHQKFILLRKDK